MAQQKILAVDVCGTLYRTNTTGALILYHHQQMKHYWRGVLCQQLLSRHSLLRIFTSIVSRVTGFDLHRALILISLRNERPARLTRSAKRFVKHELLSKRIAPAHDTVHALKFAGWTPVIVSNSIDVVIAEIGKTLGMSAISSVLEVKGGRYTGRLSHSLTGQKRAALEHHLTHPIASHQLAVITDNKSDRDLYQDAAQTIFVSQGQPRRWMRGRNAEVLCY